MPFGKTPLAPAERTREAEKQEANSFPQASHLSPAAPKEVCKDSHIKTKDGVRFVRLGLQFEGQFQVVDVGSWSAEDQEILLGESALEVKQGG